MLAGAWPRASRGGTAPAGRLSAAEWPGSPGCTRWRFSTTAVAAGWRSGSAARAAAVAAAVRSSAGAAAPGRPWAAASINLVAVLAVFDDGGGGGPALYAGGSFTFRPGGAAAPGLARCSGIVVVAGDRRGTGSGGVGPPLLASGSVVALAVWTTKVVRRCGSAATSTFKPRRGRRDAYRTWWRGFRKRSPAPTARRRGSPSPRPPKAPRLASATPELDLAWPARLATTPIPAPWQ